MKLLSVGDRVEAGSYRLHSRFRRVSNYLLEAGRPRPASLLCLVEPSVGSGPINLVLDGAPPEVDALAIESDALLLGGRRYAFGPRYDSSLPTNPIHQAMLAALADHLRAAAHPKSLAFLLDESRIRNFRDGFEQNLVRQVQAGAEQLFGEDHAQGARLLRGCGFGLTPSGDDLLAGVLIASYLAGQTCHPERSEGSPSPTPISPSISLVALGMTRLGDNHLSNAFFALAAEGRVNEAMKQLLAALGGADEDATRSAADRVLAHGVTSGADILTGLVLALHKGDQHPTNKQGDLP